MNGTLRGFPIWFIMAVITVIILPTAYSIFKNGISAKIDTKFGSAELDANAEIERLKSEEKATSAAEEQLQSDKGISPAEKKPVE